MERFLIRARVCVCVSMRACVCVRLCVVGDEGCSTILYLIYFSKYNLVNFIFFLSFNNFLFSFDNKRCTGCCLSLDNFFSMWFFSYYLLLPRFLLKFLVSLCMSLIPYFKIVSTIMLLTHPEF